MLLADPDKDKRRQVMMGRSVPPSSPDVGTSIPRAGWEQPLPAHLRGGMVD